MKTLISPLALQLANKNNLDITKIKGSGFLGRILLSDVENFKLTSQNSLENNLPNQVGQTNILITPIRNAIARALKNSQENVAYVSLLFECNLTRLWQLRKEILPKFLEKTGKKVTFLPFIIKAFALAIKEFPVFGAKLSQDQKFLQTSTEMNIGVAVDTPHGLMVPVVREADKKSIAQIQADIVDLATRCRNKTIKANELKGGIFSVTNFGSAGAITGTPVINYPELAIGGVGIIKDQLFFDKEGGFTPGKMLPITIGADHRWIDGADMGRFAKRVIEFLEKPDDFEVY